MKKRIQKILGLVLMLVLTSVLNAACTDVQEKTKSPSDEAAQEVANLQGSIVKIQVGNTRGSGVIFSQEQNRWLIVTAGHVLEKCVQEKGSVEVIWGEKDVATADDYYCSPNSETALIWLDTSGLPKRIKKQYHSVTVDKAGFDELQEGTKMFLCGAETAEGEAFCKGQLLYPWIWVEDFAQYMMLVRANSFPGMSGGGLFDEEGNFVGILCGVNDKGETAVVPLSVILAELALFSP